MGNTNCGIIIEAWGPHPGCAEFMDEPDQFRCGVAADVQFVLNDLVWDGGPYTLNACREHAGEVRLALEPGELVAEHDIIPG